MGQDHLVGDQGLDGWVHGLVGPVVVVHQALVDLALNVGLSGELLGVVERRGVAVGLELGAVGHERGLEAVLCLELGHDLGGLLLRELVGVALGRLEVVEHVAGVAGRLALQVGVANLVRAVVVLHQHVGEVVGRVLASRLGVLCRDETGRDLVLVGVLVLVQRSLEGAQVGTAHRMVVRVALVLHRLALVDVHLAVEPDGVTGLHASDAGAQVSELHLAAAQLAMLGGRAVHRLLQKLLAPALIQLGPRLIPEVGVEVLVG